MTTIETVLKAGGLLLAAAAGWTVLSAAVLDLVFRLSSVSLAPPEPEPRRAALR